MKWQANPPVPDAQAPALRLGGFVPFSTVDWPDRLAAVVFVQGCPWRCGYCHNPALQPRHNAAPAPIWSEVLGLLSQRVGLLDGVVFSGGEPTLDPALPAAMSEVRSLGFEVGLHTAGIHVGRLASLLPQLDWVGFDLKAPATAYGAVTGVPRSERPALAALALLANSRVPFEIRTTGDAALLPSAALLEMAALLARHRVQHWVLQRRRSPDGRAADPRPWPGHEVRDALARSGIGLTVR